MDHGEVLGLFDRQMRQGVSADDLGAGGERRGGVVRRGGADGDWNGVVRSGLDATTADTAIAEQVRHFTALGRDFEWKLYAHDQPHDVGARLRAAGFVPEPEETLMVAEIRDLPIDVELPEGIRLERVTDPAGVELLANAHEQALGTSSSRLREQLLDQLAQTAGLRRAQHHDPIRIRTAILRRPAALSPLGRGP